MVYLASIINPRFVIRLFYNLLNFLLFHNVLYIVSLFLFLYKLFFYYLALSLF